MRGARGRPVTSFDGECLPGPAAHATARAAGGHRFRVKGGHFLIALAGARAEILDLCPSERIKFQSLGGALLITSGVASISMWFALSGALGVNAIIAAVLALLWGLVVITVDRWLVTSIPADGTRKMLMAVPRLLLAALLGTVISVPLVLRVFQPEINAEISAMAHQQTAAVSNLRAVIASRGVAAISVPADSQVRSLTRQLDVESSLRQGSYQLWQCLSRGGPGCPAENGPLAAAAETTYNDERQRAAVLGSELRQARYQQAVTELPAALRHQAVLRATSESQTPRASGLLVRLQALSNLTAGNDTFSAARWLLLLLFLVMDSLALTMKLLQRPGNYEYALMKMEQEIHDARRALTPPRA